MQNDVYIKEQILSLLKEKHKQIDNLMTLTKEMEKVIDRNDLGSLSAVLSMRQDSMDRVDKLNEGVRDNLEKTESGERERIIALLEPNGALGAQSDQTETGIFETNRMTLSLLKRIIDLDEAINKKIRQSTEQEEPE